MSPTRNSWTRQSKLRENVARAPSPAKSERRVQYMSKDILGALLSFLVFVGFYATVRGLFESIKRSAKEKQPRQEGSAFEFFSVPRMQFVIRIVLTLLMSFAALVGITAHGEDGGLYAPLIPLTVFVLILLVRPVSVFIDQNGIRQPRWFLPDKEIAWHDVASVAYGSRTGTTYVRAKKGGAKIRFSVFLVGRNRFKQEIRAHTCEVFENGDET